MFVQFIVSPMDYSAFLQHPCLSNRLTNGCFIVFVAVDFS